MKSSTSEEKREELEQLRKVWLYQVLESDNDSHPYYSSEGTLDWFRLGKVEYSVLLILIHDWVEIL